jgi:hypothetical protein
MVNCITSLLSFEISTPSPLFDTTLANSEAVYIPEPHAPLMSMPRNGFETDLLYSEGISAMILYFLYEIALLQAHRA